MITVDLVAKDHYPPLDAKSAAELFELAVQIAQSLDDVRVRAPVGELPEETVMLDSRFLRQAGVRLF
jgi:hypothetical protein